MAQTSSGPSLYDKDKQEITDRLFEGLTLQQLQELETVAFHKFKSYAAKNPLPASYEPMGIGGTGQ